MINASVKNATETKPFRGWVIVVYVVVIGIAVDAAVLLSAAGEHSWMASAVTVFSVALISAGTLFSVLEMLKLGRSRPPR